MTATVYIGDVHDVLPKLEPGTVRAVVTSPPYFSLRRYVPGDDREIGQGSFMDWLTDLVYVFRGIEPLLTDDAVVWLNVGDTYCVDTETEILTRRGWLRWDQVQVGDEAYGLDEHTHLGEWTPITEIHRHDPMPRKMLRLEGKGHSSLTTANHRWLVENRTTPGRGQSRPGDQNGSAKLTQEIADAIREQYAQGGVRQVDLAAKYGVVFSTVGKILRGQIWNNIPRCSGERGDNGRMLRVPSRLVRTSEDLRVDDRIPTAAPQANPPEYQQWSDAFVEAIAWYATEGSDIRNSRRPCDGPLGGIAIVQSGINLSQCDAIRRCLEKLFWPASEANGGKGSPPSWTEVHRRGVGFPGKSGLGPHPMRYEWRLNAAAARVLREATHDGKVPKIEWLATLTGRQLELFIDSVMAGDGCYQPSGWRSICDQSVDRIDAYQAAAALAGIATSRSAYVSEYGTTKYILTLRNTRTMRPSRQPVNEWVEHDGPVWCPTTGTGSWLARRGGATFFTGNSGTGGAGGDHNRGSSKEHLTKYRQTLPVILPNGKELAPGQAIDAPGRLLHALQDDGWYCRSQVVWRKPIKPESIAHTKRPGFSHEMVYMLTRARNGYAFDGADLPEKGSVWDIPPGGRVKGAKAPMPRALALRCLTAMGIKEGCVLDPFLGSGTTIDAAQIVGLDSVGIDLDEEAAVSAAAMFEAQIIRI